MLPSKTSPPTEKVTLSQSDQTRNSLHNNSSGSGDTHRRLFASLQMVHRGHHRGAKTEVGRGLNAVALRTSLKNCTHTGTHFEGWERKLAFRTLRGEMP